MNKIYEAINKVTNKLSIEGEMVRNSTANLNKSGVHGKYEIQFESKYVQFTKSEIEDLLNEAGHTLENAPEELVERIIKALLNFKLIHKDYQTVKPKI
jgi:hypothetical protein